MEFVTDAYTILLALKKKNQKLRRILQASSIIVPSFFVYQINTALRKLLHKNVSLIIDYLSVINNSFNTTIIQQDNKQLAVAQYIAAMLGEKNLNNAIYHALTIEKDIIYYTANKKYYNNAKNIGNIRLTNHLLEKLG